MSRNKIVAGLVVLVLAAILPLSAVSGKTDADVIVLSKDNTIVLNSEVDGESTGKVIAAAKSLDAAIASSVKGRLNKDKPIYLFLNTPGGSIQSGLELIEALNGIGRPVNTITLFAASMGFQIAQNLGDRLILKNGVLMSHRAKGGFEGEFGGQSPSQIDSRYALWKSRLDELDQKTVDRTNGKQTLASYQKQYASEMWLTGTQSVAQGYADKVVTVKCDSSLAGTTSHEAQVLFFNVTYELDNCPINTSPMNVKVGIFTNKGTTMDSKAFAAAGGEFGPACLTASGTNPNKLCAMDTSLNAAKVREIQGAFMTDYQAKQAKVVQMY